MAHYHPNDELLMQFAAGQMPDALGIMVACHLEQCVECRHRARFYERIGGELLQTNDPVAMPTESLQLLLSRLDETPDTPPSAATAAAAAGDARLPRPLRRFVPGYYDQLPWSGMSKHIKEFVIPIPDTRHTAKFYKISAGCLLPEHTHRGNEYTMVMCGRFSDDAGEYHQGDFVLADTTTVHQPKAGPEADCICFAVLDAPLKMTGLFGRLLNPFLK